MNTADKDKAKAKAPACAGPGGEHAPALAALEPGRLPDEHAPLARALLDWFKRHKRPLPWRERYEVYEVWIAEVMLQQTQMERGAAYFKRWMERFPTLASVAAAHPDALLKAWEGLGYYSRVRNIHKTARIIMDEHGGRFPDTLEGLLPLPGIGEYTAGAVLSIAFNQPVPAVDANVERVFARLFDIDEPIKSPAASDFVRRMAALLIPPGQARDFNQALMELGALICGKKPRCGQCPAAPFCRARRLGIAAERPTPGKATSYSALEIVTGVLMHEGRIFLQKRLDSGVWAGFWEFPGGRLEAGESPEQGVVREFAEETEFTVRVTEGLGLVRHAYTRYKIAMHCFVCEFAAPPAPADSDGKPGIKPGIKTDEAGRPLPVLHAATAYRWVLPEELEEVTLPAGHRKLVEAWLPRLEKGVR